MKDGNIKNAKKVMDFIKCNIGPLLGFEILFKALTFFIFMPLFLDIFTLIMKVTGYTYLTIENVGGFLLNPLTFAMLLILILLMTIYNMFDITTIIVILDQSYKNKKIKMIDAIKISLSKCAKMIRIKNISLAFFVLFLIPFLQVGVNSSFISSIKIPEFILEYIQQNNVLVILLYVAMAFLIAVFLKWIYSIHYLVIEGDNFKESREKSSKLGKGKHLKDLFAIFCIQALILMAYIVFIFIGILIIVLLNKIFANLIIKSVSTTIIGTFMAVSYFVFSALATPISYACISVLFYKRKTEKKEKIISIDVETNEEKKSRNDTIKAYIVILSILAICTGSFFTYGLYKGKYNLNIEHIRKVEVTAHRGASVDYPENTMSAFIGAKKLGADWIELDVQQTKDGKIIVIHDKNFKRTTGVDKNTWELTYEEVSKLNAANYFDEKNFAVSDSTKLEPSAGNNEKIPLLEEVIKYAKDNNIKLNIEIKPTGYEIDIEKGVIDIINKYNFKNECIITSQIYDVLEKVKEYDKTIETMYTMSLAYGKITELKAADNFSIESASVTKDLVKRIHGEGKKLFVWTVNKEENIEKMINLHVDNIITDDITLAKELIYSSRTSTIIDEYIKAIDNIF